jgi:hypothetical protein
MIEETSRIKIITTKKRYTSVLDTSYEFETSKPFSFAWMLGDLDPLQEFRK